MKGMIRALTIIKKTLKAILWVAIVFVLLFLIIAGIIQIPAVQTKIIHAATTFVSNKTHTRVEIERVGISFPKSVIVEGLFLEDLNKDTLIFAGKLDANIALTDLLFNKISVNNIALENLNLNLYSTRTDSLFNYNFLINAFSDSTKTDIVKSKTPSAWKFTVGNIELNNIRVRYDDEFGGTNVSASLQKLELRVHEIKLDKSIYAIDDLLVEKLRANVLLSEAVRPSEKKPSTGLLPIFSANNIQINNSILNFGDSVNKLSILAAIKRFELKEGVINLQTELVDLDKVYLLGSDIHYKTVPTVKIDTAPKMEDYSPKSNWKVVVKHIDLSNNALAYTVGQHPKPQKVFDANVLKYNNLNLLADNLFYSSDSTKVAVTKLSAIDQNNFAIKQFETNFRMDAHSINALNIKATTTHSTLIGSAGIRYESLQSLKDSLPFLYLDVNLIKSGFANTDILYFAPTLGKLDFFKNKQNITSISGRVVGQVNKLRGKQVLIKTGEKTVLKTDFNIAGLPKAETAYFIFPNTKLVSGEKDLRMIAGPAIPQSISLPKDLTLLVNFNGRIKSFRTIVGLKSTYGAANLVATLDPKENFTANMNINNLDLGLLLKNRKMYGPVTLTAQVYGHGLDPKTIEARIKADAPRIYLNRYNYQHLSVDGTASGKEFYGKVNLNDENAVFDFDGLVNMTPNQERYKFHLNVQGADLQKLNFTKDDTRIGLDATADFRGSNLDDLNGKAGINSLMVNNNGKKYAVDSVQVSMINAPNKSEFNISSPFVDLKYNGTKSPTALPDVLTQFINTYFSFTAVKALKKKSSPTNFTVDVQLHNHPVISEVLLPGLTEFVPGSITGSFDSEKKELKLNAFMKHIVYGATEMNDLAIDVHSDAKSLDYKLSSSGISNSQVSLTNFLFDGKLADNKMLANVSSIDSSGGKKLLVQSEITKNNDNYRLALDPVNFYLMNNRWDIAPDNYIEFGKPGFLIHHLFLNNAQSQVNIASVNNKFNDDLNIGIKNFKLEDISRIVQHDSSFIKGDVDGNLLLKRINNAYGIIADANIFNLNIRNVPIGNLYVKAVNPTTERFDLNARLSGADNNLSANGSLILTEGNNSLNMNMDIQSLSMKTIEAFSMGEISESSGTVTGSFSATGKLGSPDVIGTLTFNNAFLKPKFLNNKLEMKHESIELKHDGVYFDNFTLLDANQHATTLNGALKTKDSSNFVYDLHVKSNDFLLFNTTAKDNKEFFGRMIIDSKIDITGPLNLPVLNARLKMKKGSNFTFAVPDDKLTSDKGENVIEFNDSSAFTPILLRKEKATTTKSGSKFDLSSIIEVDKEATLRLLMDPTSSDSLVVRGDAALSFIMDRSGKMSLTGTYNLNEGSYQISLEQIMKRKFDIIKGSTITWNGDPMNATISLDASFTVRAAPYDLVADQMDGLSDAEKAGYKQMYPFLVVLKLRGAILKPEITFEIQLTPEEKGILGGAVNQKLTMLNEDPSALNKQVFALLILSRFVQENPFASDTDIASSVVSSTVGNLITAQLNQFSSKMVKGVDLNFNVQLQGNPQLEVGLKKQLFNDRLTVQLGGSVAVQSNKTEQSSTSEITSDVTVEYKLSDDGAYRLKGFRHNMYEDEIEGQVIETGVGLVYVKDFNSWKEIENKKKKAANKKATTHTYKLKKKKKTTTH